MQVSHDFCGLDIDWVFMVKCAHLVAGDVVRTIFGGNGTAANLVMNNIGLLDFVASYSGYSLNAPDTDRMMEYVVNTYINNFADFGLVKPTVDGTEVDLRGVFKSPYWERKLIDATYNTARKDETFTML
jgi:hypothetical protein